MNDPDGDVVRESRVITRLYPPEPYGRMPRQHHANTLILDLCFSNENEWRFSEDLDSYYLKTPHGAISADGVRSRHELRDLLSLTGTEGLQLLCGTIAAFADAQLDIHGVLPEFAVMRPLTVKASDILRAIGRRPQGKNGGYSKREQDRACRILYVLSRFTVRHITGSRGADHIGPLFASVQESDGSATPRRLVIMPGQGFWNLLREGKTLLPSALLRLHPNNDRYAVAAGFYLRSLQIVRRAKPGQELVSLATIERESGIRGFDQNEYRRLQRLQAALDKLAAARIIDGEWSLDGELRASLIPGAQRRRTSTLRAIRETRLKLALPTG